MARKLAFVCSVLLLGLLITVKTRGDLLLHATFDATDIDGTTVKDVSGNNRNGEIIGGGVTSVAGVAAEALQFPFSDADLVDFGADEIFDPRTGDFGVSVWFNANPTTPPPNRSQFVVSKGNAGSGTLGWSIWMEDGAIFARAHQTDPATGGPAANEFKLGMNAPNQPLDTYHVALSIDREAGLFSGYLNGELMPNVGGGGSQTRDLLPDSEILSPEIVRVGRRSSGGAPLDGWVDDLQIYNQAFAPEDVAFLFANPGTALGGGPMFSANLVAHYTFDDADVDGDVVKDVSGNGLNGLKMNDGPATGVPGVIGQAASFDGGFNNEDNHFVDLSDHADVFGELGEGTLAAWVKPVTSEEAGNDANCRDVDVCHFTDVLTIFAASDSTQGSAEMRWVVHTRTSPFGADGPGGGQPIGHGDNYLGVRGADFNDHLISDVAGIDGDGEVSLLDGQWHHVAVTVDGDNEGLIYIDGQEVESRYAQGTDAISFMGNILPDGPDTVGIGRNKDTTAGGGQWFYHGLIDDLRVYDGALTAAEIKSLFDLGVTGDPCDYTGDGVLDINDLNLLVAEVKAGTNGATFDVNGDGNVNAADITQYVESADKLNTWVGDSNLDGEFNTTDLVGLFQAGEFEDGVAMNSTWATGDFNGDGEFGTGDLVAAFQGGGFEAGPRPAAAAVPEPSSIVLLTLGLLAIWRRR